MINAVSKYFVLLACLFITSLGASASIVAVVDSGVDYKHDYLSKNIWRNPVDASENYIDEDGNGFYDDIMGWNFGDNNNLIIDYSYGKLRSAEIVKFFEIQNKSYVSLITSDEKTWALSKLKDRKFVTDLQNYAGYMHGTHVSGIAFSGNKGIEILPVKIFSGGKSTLFDRFSKEALFYGVLVGFEEELDRLAYESAFLMMKIAVYLKGHEADVANCSFGTAYEKMFEAIGGIFVQIYGSNFDINDVHKYTKYYFETLLELEKKALLLAPDTLFVFAAGNSALDNDMYPTAPSNIQTDNSISVAATFNDFDIANFSSFGATMVDVAAPGVLINSSIPDNYYMLASGTSQAAPYVSNIAGGIKEINRSLTPGEMKQIIVGTVDYRTYLVGKVKSSGIVNKERALQAAQNSLEMPLKRAIAYSFKQVRGQKETKGFSARQGESELILPLQSLIGL